MKPIGGLSPNLPGFLLALFIGCLGGYVFSRLSIPLAWMLGSMSACTLAAILRLPIAPLEKVRPFMTAVIGVLLGSSFSTGIFSQLGEMLVSIGLMLVYIVISTLIGTAYFLRVARFDRVTAFFAAMPGGLVEMMTIGSERGGDGNLIALVHSARILFVVASLPYLTVLLSGGEMVALAPRAGQSFLEAVEPTAVAWIVACGIAGSFVGRWLRLPARYLLGPMLLSAVVHVSGVSNFHIPYQLVVVAQIILGTLIGCRFFGTPPKKILAVLLSSAGLVAVLLAILVAVVKAGDWLAIGDVEKLLLAYAPGGMTEMSLVALSVHVDVAFVSVHHIARIAFVVMLASTLSRWLSIGTKD